MPLCVCLCLAGGFSLGGYYNGVCTSSASVVQNCSVAFLLLSQQVLGGKNKFVDNNVSPSYSMLHLYKTDAQNTRRKKTITID